MQKLNLKTSERYKTIYFVIVHLELSFNHISWTLINYDNINFINLKNRTISKILEIRHMLTLERKITHWIADFSAKMTLIKLRCERHQKLVKSLQSVQEMFIYLTTTLNNLVRKSVKERGIWIGYIYIC